MAHKHFLSRICFPFITRYRFKQFTLQGNSLRHCWREPDDSMSIDHWKQELAVCETRIAILF